MLRFFARQVSFDSGCIVDSPLSQVAAVPSLSGSGCLNEGIKRQTASETSTFFIRVIAPSGFHGEAGDASCWELVGEGRTPVARCSFRRAAHEWIFASHLFMWPQHVLQRTFMMNGAGK